MVPAAGQCGLSVLRVSVAGRPCQVDDIRTTRAPSKPREGLISSFASRVKFISDYVAGKANVCLNAAPPMPGSACATGAR